MKRSFDLIVALLITPVVVFICAVCAFFIWLSDRANPFFVQTRLGKSQKPFKLIKLRTMTIGTNNAPSHEVSRSQITKLGAFLRKSKLDELPQIWNIILGDMSFVGPRPGLPDHKELVIQRARFGVFSIRPGITGPAQLAGIDMSTPELLARADSRYVENHNLINDIRYIFQTAVGSGSGDAAK